MKGLRVKILIIFLVIVLLFNFSSCTKKSVERTKQDGMVFYEVFVRAFYDSDGDGIGDLKGLTEKLPYIKSLGVNGIWLMPIFKSPSYHGYDVTDYYNINPDYGTNEDFINFLNEAHKLGIKVIIDLVVNHTSSKHPWFLEADTSPKSKFRDYYIWATPDTKLNEPSALGTKQWYNKGSGFYNAIFWSEMPDLNFDNKNVRKEIKKIAKYWLEKGVDGFRLDAAMHIYPPNRFQDTLNWWKEFGDYCRSIKKDVYLVGEVWSSERAIAPYLKYLDSCFNFKLSEGIIDAVMKEDSSKLQYNLPYIYNEYKNSYKDYVDAPFLTNHDMDRVMSKIDDINKMKLAASILLTMPGNPFIYYGEEIGMKGEKPDEYIREPFKWGKEFITGQTRWIESEYNVGDYAPSVEEQDKDPNSLLNYYRNMIKFRLGNEVISKGDITIIKTQPEILAYFRVLNDDKILIVNNLTGNLFDTELQLEQNSKIKGEVIKGEGLVQLENNKIRIRIKPYSTVIVK